MPRLTLADALHNLSYSLAEHIGSSTRSFEIGIARPGYGIIGPHSMDSAEYQGARPPLNCEDEFAGTKHVRLSIDKARNREGDKAWR